MCEKLLNLQKIFVSGQNICTEVYGNSVGTFTPNGGNIVVNSSRSRTRLSHFSHRIWEIHAEYTCFLRLRLLAKIGYVPQCKGKNPRGLYEISFPLTTMMGGGGE